MQRQYKQPKTRDLVLEFLLLLCVLVKPMSSFAWERQVAALNKSLPATFSAKPLNPSIQFQNWGLQNKSGNSHIHALDAWKVEEGSRDIVVAVIDTGIDANHKDLKENLWHGEKGIYGWDFVKNKPNPTDEHGHGTHVSGILGAALNAKAGISGVAHRVSIMAIKYYSVQNSGAKNLENSVKALNWAIDHGAHIINYSGGGPEPSLPEREAILRARDKGILIVAAAGNEHENSDQRENFYYPCAYRLDNIVCVSSTNISNELLNSSNWGRNTVDVAAPGENILSTAPGGKYVRMSGTSQATAFVTGIAALLLSKKRVLKPAQVKDILRASVDKMPSLRGRVFAEGRVNAAQALAMIEPKKEKLAVLPIKKEEVKKRNLPSSRQISSPTKASFQLKL